MPRPRNTDDRRAAIAAALLRVMAREGYDGASITAIAAEAGLRPGLVHYHFQSKQAILLSALASLVARRDAGLERRLAAAEGDPAREVEAFIDFHLGVGTDADPEALACWAAIGAEARRAPEVGAALRQALASSAERLTATIRRGMARRLFRYQRAEAAAAAILAAVQGYYALAAAAPDVIPRGSAARSVARMAAGLLDPARPLGADLRALRRAKGGRPTPPGAGARP